jgi:hypothetical protein
MKRLLGFLFLGLILGGAAMHAVVSHSMLESFALLSIGLIAADSLSGALFGVHVLGNYGQSMWQRPGYGRPAPNRNDVVGWGLSNLLAPIADPISALGQLASHPSFAGLGHLLESPFQGIAQAFGGGQPGWMGGQPQPNAMQGYHNNGGPLPAPVPALGQGMVQGHAGHDPRAIVSYMGLGAVSWVGTDASIKTLSPEPQAPFIGNRLVLVRRASTGADARQVLVSSPLTVSGIPQTPAPNVPAPVEMFAENATYSALQIQIAAAGTEISISFSIDAAPGGTDFVNLSCGMYGYWLR